MNTNSITADQAIDTLVVEGHDRADALAAFDSLVDAGLDDQSDDGDQFWVSESDMAVLRAQLAGE